MLRSHLKLKVIKLNSDRRPDNCVHVLYKVYEVVFILIQVAAAAQQSVWTKHKRSHNDGGQKTAAAAAAAQLAVTTEGMITWEGGQWWAALTLQRE